MEVDLHIEKIRERYPAARNIPDSDALYVQLDVFEKTMAEAFRTGLRSVVFIHGSGRGVLRSELLKRLREYPGAVVQEASPLRYGNGAIEVFIKYLLVLYKYPDYSVYGGGGDDQQHQVTQNCHPPSAWVW